MDIGNIFGKIEGNADKLGAVVGAVGGIQEHAWGKDLFSGINIIIDGLMKSPHFPDLSHVWYHLNYPGNKMFKTALGALIMGYILNEVNIDPKINRLGSALSKGGWGAVMGLLGVNILIYSGAANSPSGPSGGGNQIYWGR